jgi:hypothetical protein
LFRVDAEKPVDEPRARLSGGGKRCVNGFVSVAIQLGKNKLDPKKSPALMDERLESRPSKGLSNGGCGNSYRVEHSSATCLAVTITRAMEASIPSRALLKDCSTISGHPLLSQSSFDLKTTPPFGVVSIYLILKRRAAISP